MSTKKVDYKAKVISLLGEKELTPEDKRNISLAQGGV